MDKQDGKTNATTTLVLSTVIPYDLKRQFLHLLNGFPRDLRQIMFFQVIPF